MLRPFLSGPIPLPSGFEQLFSDPGASGLLTSHLSTRFQIELPETLPPSSQLGKSGSITEITMDETRLALTVAEVAKAAGVGRTTVFEEIRHGRLVARKVGRRTIIMAGDLDAWLNSLPQRSNAVTSAGEGR